MAKRKSTATRRPQPKAIRVYHGTTRPAAAAIERDGFKDTTGSYLTVNRYTGVWVSNTPLDVNDTSREYDGDSYFAIDVEERVIARFEWIEEGKPYREWLVPAAVLNALPRVRLTEEEYWEISQARFFPSRR
jgi:hypothetical protein